MREIKFRVWDSLVNKMLKVESHNFKLGMPNGCYMMQYTGLKDKNSKEIYEGDIVKFVIPEDEPKKEKRIIFWSKALCGFQAKTLDSKYHCFVDGELFEIIGNIYENPELLKRNK